MRVIFYAGLIAILAGVGLLTVSTTQASRSNQAINTIGSPGVAVRGYDVVAYFTSQKPKKGQKKVSLKHAGVEWWFASAENRQRFQSNPEKYMPAYGGFCAYGVSRNYRVKTEPDAWTIHKGKLYLNYDKSVRSLWLKKTDQYIKRADRNWANMF